MADTNLAAKRYAQAVFELAVAANSTESWSSALQQIADFMSDSEVRRVLENTRVLRTAKEQLIDAALGDLPAQAHNLARLLVRKGRTALARPILDEYLALLEKQRGIARAKATTAVPLSDAERNALVTQLRQQTGRDIILETAVDPEIIGGIVVQVGDSLVDASTKAKLQALRESLVGAI
jgi:F-type H+-transporting ATPase subunit delta